MSKIVVVAFLSLISAASAQTVVAEIAPLPTSPTISAGNICRAAIEIAEIHNEIPGELLQAVALNETGKWNEKQKSLIAWPWTLTVEGNGHYYENYGETLAALKKYRKKGISNIDVGCLQINVNFHAMNFNTLEEMLNPINNVAYGAAFLTHLRKREHSWTRAVKHYHSANRMYNLPYSKKVIKTWQKLRNAKMQQSQKKPTATQVSKFINNSSTINGLQKQQQSGDLP